MTTTYDFSRELGPIKTSNGKGLRMFTTIPADVFTKKSLAIGDELSIQFNNKSGCTVYSATVTIICKNRISYNKATDDLNSIFGLSSGKKTFGFVEIKKGEWLAEEI